MQTLTGMLTVLMPLLLLLIGLALVCLTDPYIRRGQRRIMMIIVALCLVLILQNLGEDWLASGPPRPMFRTVFSILGYTLRPVFLILFLYIVQPEGKRWYWWTLAGLNAAVNCTALFSGICFHITEDNLYMGGPLSNMALYVSVILLVNLLVHTLMLARSDGTRAIWIPLAISAAIIGSVIMDGMVGSEGQPVTYLTIVIVVGSVFFYIWLHRQFVRAHEMDLMAAQRIRIMMTQIQPHFLFNALNTIRALYAKDPPLADRTLEEFSAYLRQNLETLDQSGLIPVSRELEHTRIYSDIEMLRFPNVKVEYNAEDTDFDIPALTVQPLVENAVRHGVRSLKEGRVTVSTVRDGGYHRITVSDNGLGFDPGQQELRDGTHIGLQNVTERVEKMCGGTVTIESAEGEGTTVTMLFPENTRGGRKER